MIGVAAQRWPSKNNHFWFETSYPYAMNGAGDGDPIETWTEAGGRIAMWSPVTPTGYPFRVDEVAIGVRWTEPRPLLQSISDANLLRYYDLQADLSLPQPLHIFMWYYHAREANLDDPVRHLEEWPLVTTKKKCRIRNFQNGDGYGVNVNFGTSLRTYGGDTTGSTVLLEVVANGDSSKIFIDGVQQLVGPNPGSLGATADAGNSNLTNWVFGFRGFLNAWTYFGCFAGEQTGAAQQEIRDYMTLKRGEAYMPTVTL